MDVTRLSGALRAVDGRAPVAREAGPAFESFLPAEDGAAARRESARPEPRAARDGRAVERAEQRASEQHRAEQRRIEQRRIEQRRADEERAAEARDAREAEERAAEERAAEERRAEQAAARADARRAAEAHAPGDAVEPGAPPTAESDDDPLQPIASEGPAPVDVRPTAGAERSLARTPDAAAFAGSAGLQGLVQWLEGQLDGPRAQRSLELAAGQGVEGFAADDIDGPPIAMADGQGEAADAADADPAAELTRLLEARTLPGELIESGRETRPRAERAGPVGAQSTQSQPQHGLAGPGASPMTAARITDAGAAARAGSTPTALPEGVDESSIMRQISDALRLRGGRTGRAQTAEIALNPAELGRVRIKIRMHGDSARVLVSAEHGAVGDLLGAGLDQLRRDLMAHGVQVAHLEVRSGLADEGGARRDAPEHDEADEPDAAESPLEARPVARRARGRIDVEA